MQIHKEKYLYINIYLRMAQSEELFTTRMRKATRSIHSLSDALVNAKFALCKFTFFLFTLLYLKKNIYMFKIFQH